MSDKRIFLETMFDGFTPDSVSREELISILLDDLMVVARDNLSIEYLENGGDEEEALKLNIYMIREIKNNHPAVPEPFLNESKLLDVEEDCRKAFLSSRTGRLGAFGRAFHSFIEAPSGDLVSAYILAIDSEDERKADVLLRFYTAPGERAVLLYRDTIAFVSETMPEPGDTVTVKSSREFSKDVMLNHRFPIG